ncbi:Beta-glucan synthesis-associated protein KRE6 [Seminavis robusta]|uniref:Beta-glucan synthesis-associated protein KRE6 n=1 Tax=Seminavis robusta TaxID=568900 RepID=A0A9N8E232_9STRA|nr:Beta-glucan synthesis-associated protein KRE6 [Seminavis robusta]|eukprot:Sro570_g168480.1 Beta-glucan synthesis-associated protein KRE6 (634) ;mRNA; f:14476-16588
MSYPSNSDWIDPDTPLKEHVISPLSRGDSRGYRLVFSEEFQVEGRTFRDGEDPRWTALDKNDITNNPLHYYSDDADAVSSHNGSLSIRLSIEQRDDLLNRNESGPFTETKEFKSGMLQSWNKFCFTGGIVEFSAKMPGDPNVAGLWPAIWMMGNLGRATYINSTENKWPFSTNVCDNRTRNSQLVNSCPDSYLRGSAPTMPQGSGRGAPEIDLLEVMMMDEYFESPILSTSLQVAPGVPTEKRPLLGQEPNASNTWYSPEFGDNATRNTYFYGTWSFPADPTTKPYQTDSISANMALGNDFYENFHKFRVEWEPPEEESGYGGYIKWFIDGKLVTAVYGDDLQNTSQTEIPSEPMYLVMNLAVSKDWGFPDAYFKDCPKKCWSCQDPACACALPKGFCDNMPTSLEIDSVRVYQPTSSNKYTTGCSPPNRPTKAFIEAHNDDYKLSDDEFPLKQIQVGGGSCNTDSDCGTVSTTRVQGICVRGNLTASSGSFSCACRRGWVGPHCLASFNGDVDEEWNNPFENGPQGTTTTSDFRPATFVWMSFLMTMMAFCLHWKSRTEQRVLLDDVKKSIRVPQTSYKSFSPLSSSTYGTTARDDDMDTKSSTPPAQEMYGNGSYQNDPAVVQPPLASSLR